LKKNCLRKNLAPGKTSIKQKHTQQRGETKKRKGRKEGRKEGRKKQTAISLIALFRQDRKNLANLELGTWNTILLALPTTKARILCLDSL
jgi:flagellar biosynthesis/type III secretory pathway protein FliH